MNLYKRLQCKLFGHKRGKRVPGLGIIGDTSRTYQCPRCKATWLRKVKAS